jgi:hypothetical protein
MERRDHVLMGRLLFVATASSTFLARARSMNGPFLTERATFKIPLMNKLQD